MGSRARGRTRAGQCRSQHTKDRAQASDSGTTDNPSGAFLSPEGHLEGPGTALSPAVMHVAVCLSSQRSPWAQRDRRTLGIAARSEATVRSHGGHHVLLGDGHAVPPDVLLLADTPQCAGPGRGYVVMGSAGRPCPKLSPSGVPRVTRGQAPVLRAGFRCSLCPAAATHGAMGLPRVAWVCSEPGGTVTGARVLQSCRPSRPGCSTGGPASSGSRPWPPSSSGPSWACCWVSCCCRRCTTGGCPWADCCSRPSPRGRSA